MKYILTITTLCFFLSLSQAWSLPICKGSPLTYKEGDALPAIPISGWDNCEGIFIWENHSKYYGEWKGGNISGQGKLIFENGDRYEGEWKDNMIYGQGVFTTADGEKQIGEWKNGELVKGKTYAVGEYNPIKKKNTADFDKGLNAYNKGDYENALKEWQPLAEQGHAIAQFKLGWMFANGQGVFGEDINVAAREDNELAAHWYKLSAEQGYASAQYNLGIMYETFSNNGLRQDKQKAFNLYLLAAEQGHLSAQYRTGYAYQTGLGGIKKDDKKAFKWYLLAAKKGLFSAEYEMGRIYKYGWGVNIDYEKSLKWYRVAANNKGDTILSHFANPIEAAKNSVLEVEEMINKKNAVANRKDNLSDFYFSYIFVKNCNDLNAFYYVDEGNLQTAKKSIKNIENDYKRKNKNIDTDVEWNKATKKWKKDFESMFSMMKSMDTYSGEIEGMCKLYLLMLNGVGNSLDKGTIEKDF